MSKCNRCYREAEYPLEDEQLCHDHYVEAEEQAEENAKINARDAELEERLM